MPGYNGGIGGDSENNGGNNAGGGYGGGGDGVSNPYGLNVTMPANEPGYNQTVFEGLADQYGNPTMNGQLFAMNPILGLGQYLSQFPNNPEAINAFNNMQNNSSGGSLDPNGYLTPAGNSAPGAFGSLEDAGLYGMNQAANLYGAGPTQMTNGPDTLNAQANIRGLSSQPNPYINNALNTANSQMTTENPFLQGFGSFQNMQNDQLGNMYDQGARKIQDSLNSQFGTSGRTGSAYHSGTMGQSLGDFGANLYGNAFENMQNRNLSALQGGANTFYNQNAQQLNAASMAPQLSQARYYDPLMQQALGEGIDQQAYNNANSGWDNLNKYSSTLATLQGSQPTPERAASSTDKLLGLLGTGYGLYSMFGG